LYSSRGKRVRRLSTLARSATLRCSRSTIIKTKPFPRRSHKAGIEIQAVPRNPSSKRPIDMHFFGARWRCIPGSSVRVPVVGVTATSPPARARASAPRRPRQPWCRQRATSGWPWCTCNREKREREREGQGGEKGEACPQQTHDKAAGAGERLHRTNRNGRKRGKERWRVSAMVTGETQPTHWPLIINQKARHAS